MLEDIIKERLRKRDNLIRAGYNAYPSKIERSCKIGDVLRRFFFLSLLRRRFNLGGRITGMRIQGGVMFLDIKDESGKIQAVLNKKLAKDFDVWKENLDIGDFVIVKGKLFKTKKGEQSINVQELAIAAKSLRPIPSEWYGLKDVEERYRKRYLDIFLNDEVRAKIAERSDIIRNLREILICGGFLEVETPMLQPLPGGAIARPFKTHHNALDSDFYLRIAPELYLKRLLVAGFEKIFEIGRNFRNEGIDRDHNPEFTMLELYWVYQDYNGLMGALKKWLTALLDKLNIESIVYGDQQIDFKKEWPILTYEEAIKKYSGKNLNELNIEEIDDVFKKDVRPKLIQPTFVIHYPKVISPLAKSCKDRPELTERFQLIVAGTELANGFSELNDPEEQRKRMEEQEKMYRLGRQEASRLDEDFLEALEYGMPPAAGLGIGIDRLAALLTNAVSLKEVIIFPTLRPKG
jgi:lysyl-tRNA synthetase class 2